MPFDPYVHLLPLLARRSDLHPRPELSGHAWGVRPSVNEYYHPPRRVLLLTDIHTNDSSFMQPVHHFLGWNPDRAYEKLGSFFDDDTDELVQIALGIIIVGLPSSRAQGRDQEINSKCYQSALFL